MQERSPALSGAGQPVRLARTLTLSHAVLYGLGVTIGAGIYVLIGAMAGAAGIHAPVAFFIAAALMAPTAASYAELAGRLPMSAGAAAYVGEAFGSVILAVIVGGLVAAIGMISAAAIAIGGAGYLRTLLPVSHSLAVVLVVLTMGAVAACGIRESVSFAGAMTLIEIVGLILLIGAALILEPDLVARAPSVLPAAGDGRAWAGIAAAGMLAFFAFIGFESLANIAEEVVEPRRTLARAIGFTLGISTLLYFLVSAVAVLTIPPIELAASAAPLSLVFAKLTRISPAAFGIIALIATLNGVIVQIIMVSRVLYGLAERGAMPEGLAYVHPVTRTPLIATGLVIGVVLVLALAFPIASLANWTTQVTLGVFALVNAALIRLKRRAPLASAQDHFVVPLWVPVAGAVSCLIVLVIDVVSRSL